MNKRFKETSNRGAVGWFLQRSTAVIIFVLLLIHFVTYHFLGKGKAVSYQQIIAKTSSWWFPLIQFIFLITGLFHGLYGTWVVLEDYVHNKYWRFFWHSVLITLATVLMFVGTLTIIQVSSLRIS